MAGLLAVSLMASPAMASAGGGETPPAAASGQRAPKTVDHELGEGGHALKVTNVNAGATYRFYKLLDVTAVPSEDGGAITSYRYETRGENAPAITEAFQAVLDENPGFTYDKDTNPMGFQVNKSFVLFQKPALDEASASYADDLKAQNEAESKLMYAFADALRAKINEAGAELTADITVTPGEINGGDVVNGDTIRFSGLADGYWMVATDAGVRSIVFTNPSDKNGDVEMANKNPAPAMKKEAWNNDDVTGGGKINYEICTDADCGSYTKNEAGEVTADSHTYLDKTTGETATKGDPNAVPVHVGKYGGSNDIGVNDETTFRISLDVKSGARNLLVVDTLDKGLRFGGELDSVIFYPRKDADTLGREVVVDADGAKSDKIELYEKDSGKARSEYTLTRTDLEDGRTKLEIKFDPAFLDPAKDDTSAMAKVFKGDPSTIEDDGGKIEIIYTVKLTDAGIMKEKLEFTNSAILKYSGDPDAGNHPESWLTTGETSTTTHTYELDLLKHVLGDEKAVLENAKFVMYRRAFNATSANYADGKITISEKDKAAIKQFEDWVNAGANTVKTTPEGSISNDADLDGTDIPDNYYDGKGVMYFKLLSAGDGTNPSVYAPVVYDGGTTNDPSWVHELVTPASGKVVIRGLDAGLYAFGETAAPEGYNKLETPVMAVVGDTVIGKGGKVFTSDKDDAAGLKFVPLLSDGKDSIAVPIANASGIRMPSTGGIGTRIFYALGGVLVLGAGVLLIVKKRTDGGE